MSIRFISGKPGGGKTLYAVTLVIEELKRTRRFVVTNLPIKLPELAAYLQGKYGDDFNCRWRVVFLQQEQVGEFWRYCGYQPRLSEEKVLRHQRGGKEETARLLDFSPRLGLPEIYLPPGVDAVPGVGFKPGKGVLYVIDEVHEFFNARKWASTGDEALHYLSQHRHLGDDVICITQSIGNVDKQFRSVAQDFTYLRNHSKESLKILGGLFRSPRMFQRDTFLEPYTGSQTSFEHRWFKLDLAVAGCYDTAAGVGVSGSGADTGEKRRGLPPWMLILPLIGLWYLLSHIDVWAAGAFAKRDKAAVQKAAAARQGSAPPAVTRALTVATNVTPADRVSTNLVSTRSQEKVKPPEVWLTGLVLFGDRVSVCLSDGRTLHRGDPELQAFGSDWAKVNGKVMRFNYHPDPPQ